MDEHSAKRPKPPGKCIFCGRRGQLSKEHVFPDWLSQLFPKSPSDTHQHGTVTWKTAPDGKPFRTPVIRRRQGQAGSKKVRTVCETCNNGWLSVLENTTKPLLSEIVRGRARLLDNSDQLILATWIAKTAMVAE